MFGQFVVHLDYMLSTAPACHVRRPEVVWVTIMAPNREFQAFFFGRVA